MTMQGRSMRSHSTFRRAASLAVGLAGLALVTLAGCQTGNEPGAPGMGVTGPPTREEALRNTESNIIGVVAYYSPSNPWLWSDDRSRVEGVRVQALYLVGPHEKGVFGDGVVRPKIYVRDRSVADPAHQWKLAREWAFYPEDLLLYRTKKPTIQGYGYLLPLRWGNEIDLSGREIRIVINYERTDGLFPRPSSKDLRVPRNGA